MQGKGIEWAILIASIVGLISAAVTLSKAHKLKQQANGSSDMIKKEYDAIAGLQILQLVLSSLGVLFSGSLLASHKAGLSGAQRISEYLRR